MRTFAELLTFYMERTGIGDAELARRIPVSRPTLIRWREGITTRPRYREDVLRCAELLRLTPSETDEFLQAAGFSPESSPIEVDPRPADDAVEETAPILVEAEAVVVPGPTRRRRRVVVAAVALALVIVAVGAFAIAMGLRDTTDYPTAMDGESLIVIAPFVNYTGGQQGYNVLGRLKHEIDSEVNTAGLSGVRTVEWPKQIASESSADEAGRRSDAVIVIWGEYDSGRVMARFTTPRVQSTQRDRQVVDIASSPSELPATINADLTEQVRYVALLTLGQLYLEQGEHDLAKKVLIHASDSNPTDPAALANLRYLLGRSYLGGRLSDFDEAVWLFTQVLAVRPRSVEALNSRALAYLERDRAGDVDRAIDDLAQAATVSPTHAATYVNLAAAHVERGTAMDLDRAIAELTEALEIQPGYASAYVNRAGAYVARDNPGDLERAFEDVDDALDENPDLAPAHVARGNAHLARGSEGDLARALEDYSRAIELDPDSPTAYFNRGLVYSEIENWGASLSDLRWAHALSPNNVAFSRVLCWQMAVSGSAEEALPVCERAVTHDPTSQSSEARGVAYALTGRTEKAVADLEAFLEWVEASPKDSCRDLYQQSRADWIDQLRTGNDPFDPATLRGLRVRPVSPGAAPC